MSIGPILEYGKVVAMGIGMLNLFVMTTFDTTIFIKSMLLLYVIPKDIRR